MNSNAQVSLKIKYDQIWQNIAILAKIETNLEGLFIIWHNFESTFASTFANFGLMFFVVISHIKHDVIWSNFLEYWDRWLECSQISINLLLRPYSVLTFEWLMYRNL